ncbi:hypothetical protein FG91_01667 [Sphingopyxis sp. LC81]|uniref:hypothetical protein n=1 Tax=Sphingopyxis sp. LC81 TaxID=1502850 RepID=UPI00050E6690|nr:hypothetical protein [Sphingopyxis sp. LC81]KGB55037.1 hypothetical protein FG91_01667 [Sphingopyxis sp. LC81]
MPKSKIFGAVMVILAAAAATPAAAQGITYLECNMTAGGEGDDIIWKLALDERAKTVSFEHPQASGTLPATFAADKVTWKGGRFSVSRINLTFSREFLGVVDTGKCKVVQPPKRAF